VHCRRRIVWLCANEMIQHCIYTNLGAYMRLNSYFGSSNLLYYFYGPTSLLGNYISTLLLFPMSQLIFCGLIFHFILFRGVLQLFNGIPLTSCNLILLSLRNLQLSKREYLPTTTKCHQHSRWTLLPQSPQNPWPKGKPGWRRNITPPSQ
jgi:hypothetical protein